MGKAARLKAQRHQERETDQWEAEKATTGRARPGEYYGQDDKVAVAYVHPDQVSTLFHLSMLRLFLYDGAHHKRITGGGAHLSKFSSANVSNARNDAVRDFLNLGGKPDWLWFVDADMEFPHDVVDRLVSSAYADGVRKASVVGALCFGTHDGKLFPTLYGLTEHDGEVRAVRYHEWPEDAMFQVAATGAACLLIHRTVIEKMLEHQTGLGNTAYPWFQETVLGGRPCGEDFTFCLRAGALDFPVWVNTSVKIGHHKSHVLTAEMYEKQLEADRDAESEAA